jgi:hypothetical protein
MEPRPPQEKFPQNATWWLAHIGYGVYVANRRKVRSLDALHEVEARLTDEQWWIYMGGIIPRGHQAQQLRFALHASAEQKIETLATVLRLSQPQGSDAGPRAQAPQQEEGPKSHA